MRLVLASASPRRHELLSHLGIDFDVVVSGVDEDAITAARPETLARRLAAAKALDVAAQHPNATVLAADTVVAYRGQLLAKPADSDQARAMLARLRGRWHRVITGVALLQPGRRRPQVEHVASRVLMRRYEAEGVEASIARGDPFDKAGGYGIQDPLFRPVESWEGCYCNVMGLPLWTAVRLLSAAGLRPSIDAMPTACATCSERGEATQT